MSPGESVEVVVPTVVSEFATLSLGDARLHERTRRVVDRLCSCPAAGFPQSMTTEAELEGFYRLVGNERVSYAALMQPHIEQTVRRCANQRTARAVHDTTEVSFPAGGVREGLGPLGAGRDSQGFFAHITLASQADKGNSPLGVLAMTCFARPPQPRPKTRKKMAGNEYARFDTKESGRWLTQVEAAEQAVEGKASLVHIMDREADAYPLLATLVDNQYRFVVRVTHDRVVCELDEDGAVLDDEGRLSLSEALLQAPIQLERQVPLSSRRAHSAPRSQRSHPERPMRTARLGLSAQSVVFQRPRYASDDLPEGLPVHIVYVRELDTPLGQDPVTWVLVTNEPIDTLAQIEQVLDHYCARWLIEEFFKALKTGCALEERQLESFRSLTNMLALFLPIAWQMLLLRALSRLTPDAPADQALTPTQIALLCREQPAKMKKGATVRDALYAVAGLGGHLKHNGPPGWLTLARGMQELLRMEIGWHAALEEARSMPAKM
jgi:hypothetical protein